MDEDELLKQLGEKLDQLIAAFRAVRAENIILRREVERLVHQVEGEKLVK